MKNLGRNILKALKQNKSILLHLIIWGGVFLLLISCVSAPESYIPFDSMTYPKFVNGYNNRIILFIKYTDEKEVQFELASKQGSVERESGRKYKFVKIFDTNNNLIVEYSEEYLNTAREKVPCLNEMWVAYEGGLVLIPEEYHEGDFWEDYIKTRKKE